MTVYRLCKSKYKDDLSGKGAEIAGGRWNSKGTPMLYTAQSRALCVTEIAVHTPLGILPDDYYLITIDIPENSIKELPLKDLPTDWKTVPYTSATQQAGNIFVQQNKYLVLKVPSATVQGDFNLLINPAYKDFKKVKIIAAERFEFNERLFK